MGRIKSGWIIHIFALLHVAVTLLCRYAGFEDEILLTMLTMTMALLLSLKNGFSIELTAACIIVVNIIGYLLGTAGAKFFALIFDSQYVIHSLSTALTTEILGGSIVILSKIFKKGFKDKDSMSSSYISWLILAIVVVFFMRLAFVFLLSSDVFADESISLMSDLVLSNSFALIILLCINILYIWSARRLMKRKGRAVKLPVLIAFTLLAALLEAVLVNVSITESEMHLVARNFLPLYIVALIAQITIYCLVYVVNFAITSRSKMQEARGRANIAQYRYQILKRQVNPHFLFNSLNVLDCLVCEQKTEQASTYIHKLAGVYRYMIKSEDENLVTMEEELKFVEKYVDLMMVRFPEGFKVEIDVPEECLQRQVLPCSLQLLIENAVKHNVISAPKPLIVSIKIKDDSIHVTNNVNPKLTQVASTGLGQKYIMKQYLDLTGKAIAITNTGDKYSVVLPLI